MQPPEIKRTFKIDIAEGEAGVIAVVTSITEQKVLVIKAPTMRLLLAEIGRVVKKRRSHLRRFPAPEPSPIMTVEESLVKPSRLILPSNGN